MAADARFLDELLDRLPPVDGDSEARESIDAFLVLFVNRLIEYHEKANIETGLFGHHMGDSVTPPGLVDETLSPFMDHDPGRTTTAPHRKAHPQSGIFLGLKRLDGGVKGVHVAHRGPQVQSHTVPVTCIERRSAGDPRTRSRADISTHHFAVEREPSRAENDIACLDTVVAIRPLDNQSGDLTSVAGEEPTRGCFVEHRDTGLFEKRFQMFCGFESSRFSKVEGTLRFVDFLPRSGGPGILLGRHDHRRAFSQLLNLNPMFFQPVEEAGRVRAVDSCEVVGGGSAGCFVDGCHENVDRIFETFESNMERLS